MCAGIHGFRHCGRVGMLAALICDYAGVKDNEFVWEAVLAGSLHDCRRLNDHRDRGHGARTAEWFREHRDEIAKFASMHIHGDSIARIYAAIKFHDVSRQDTPPEVYTAYGRAIDILKAADALDRYRLPLSQWWIDDSYLHIKPPAVLKRTALQLVLLTERVYLETGDNRAAFRAVAQKVRYG